MRWWMSLLAYYHPKNPFFNLTAVLLGCNLGQVLSGTIWGILIGGAAVGAVGIVMGRVVSAWSPAGKAVNFYSAKNIFVWFSAAWAAILYVQITQP